MTHRTMYNTFLCLVQFIVNDYFIVTVIHFIILIVLIMLQLYTNTKHVYNCAWAAFSIYTIFNRAYNISKKSQQETIFFIFSIIGCLFYWQCLHIINIMYRNILPVVFICVCWRKSNNIEYIIVSTELNYFRSKSKK